MFRNYALIVFAMLIVHAGPVGAQVAARLSYHLWETMPDQQLWDAAASGALRTPQGYAREVDRLFGDPRSRKVLQKFYRQWLRVEFLSQSFP